MKKQRVRSLSLRGPVIYEGGGEEWLVQMEGGRVITFNATKNGRTKNLSLVWGGSEGFGTHEG